MRTSFQVTPLRDDAHESGSSAANRLRLASPTTALVLAVLALVSAVSVVVLAALIHDSQDGLGANVPWVVTGLAFAAVGYLVARRQPGNPIGWILLAIALGLLLSCVGTTYSVLDFRLHHGTLPLGLLAVWLGLLWAPAIVLVAMPVLLFPSGFLPSTRWRWTLWAYLTACTTSVASSFWVAAATPIAIPAGGNPTFSHLTGVVATLEVASHFLLVVGVALWLTWIVRMLVTYQRALGDRRQQYKWLMVGSMLTVIASVLLVAGPWNSAAAGSPGLVLVYWVSSLGTAGLPIALGVGILKYRLYDVDRLISRTLSYGIVTGLLIGVYVGLVTLATRVLPFSSPLGVAASTLVAVALFNPLRRRVQRVVDRRFNRARYNAEATVSSFAHRVRNDVDLEVVSSEFVKAVQASVEPSHVSLWLRPTGSST